MHIKVGCEIKFTYANPTAIVLMLYLHPSVAVRLWGLERLEVKPCVAITEYVDWYAFDARNNVPRIGRILMARGRDAADVALTTTFGVNQLQFFQVWADEVPEGTLTIPARPR